MGRFDRDNGFNRGGGGGFGGGRRDFKDRGSRGPVTMHNTTCDQCGKECEVPFRPTAGKPVYCRDCFDKNRDSDSSRSESRFQRPQFNDRPSFSSRSEGFETVCDECGKNCTVPFRPTEGKPVYCKDCFGDKKNNGERSTQNGADYKQQFETLNGKLDQILKMLAPEMVTKIIEEESAPSEVAIAPEVETKISKPKKAKAPKK